MRRKYNFVALLLPDYKKDQTYLVLVQFDLFLFFQRRQYRSCDVGAELSGWRETRRVSAKLLQTNHHHLRRGSTGRLGYPSIKVGSH